MMMTHPAPSPHHTALRRIRAAETRPLRHAVLRPNQPIDDCIYPLDDHPSSGHFGAFVGPALVGVASIYHEAPPGEADPRAWRIRGMATLEHYRGLGYGKALLEACLTHAKEHAGTRAWCNARTTVMGFYQGAGFIAQGEEFPLPGIGPHYMMECVLASTA